MNIKEKMNFKRSIANFFGAFGYLSCILQWLWAVMLYFSLIESAVLFFSSPASDSQIIKPIPATANVITTINSGPNIFSIIIAAIVIAIMVALTLYIFIKMPSIIIKTSKKVVQETADNVAPLVLRIQHKKDTKGNKIKLTPILVIIMKIILVTIPTILAIMSRFIENQMIDSYISTCVGLFLAGSSLLFFGAQYLVGKFFAIKRQDLC